MALQGLVTLGEGIASGGVTHRVVADAVLLDIEGTISPVHFVKQTLFPYAKERLAEFVTVHRDEPGMEQLLGEAASLSGGADPITALLDWMDRDAKAPPLKKIQGMIWEEGYRSGAMRSSLFPDALDSLRHWHAERLPIYIYSSGSVQAQRLFFEFTTVGDLRPLIARHFDTDAGAKTDALSYARIAHEVGLKPAQFVFFSDTPLELTAARAAGVQSFHVVKEDTKPDPAFPALSQFSQVVLVRRDEASDVPQ